LVVIAIIAILAALLLPVLANAKQQAQAAKCMSNSRQLMIGWMMYADDNNNLLAPNDYPYETPYYTYPTKYDLRNWVCGTMAKAIDSVQTVELTDPVGTALAHYVSNPYVYLCPADKYIDPYSNKNHVRSISMNSAVGSTWSSFYLNGSPALGAPVQGGWLDGSGYSTSQTTWMTYGKITSFIKPGSANTWVIMDEHPYSINDASLAIAATNTATGGWLIDFPSGNHNNAAGIAFADGHAIIHKWMDPGDTCNPQKFGVIPGNGSGSGAPYTVATDADCLYLAHITSAQY